MNFRLKKISLVVLGITAIICSRALFFFFNDIEGPNLLIVGVFAIALFLLSFAVNAFAPSKIDHLKKLSMAVGVQLLSVIVLYFFMR